MSFKAEHQGYMRMPETPRELDGHFLTSSLVRDQQVNNALHVWQSTSQNGINMTQPRQLSSGYKPRAFQSSQFSYVFMMPTLLDPSSETKWVVDVLLEQDSGGGGETTEVGVDFRGGGDTATASAIKHFIAPDLLLTYTESTDVNKWLGLKTISGVIDNDAVSGVAVTGNGWNHAKRDLETEDVSGQKPRTATVYMWYVTVWMKTGRSSSDPTPPQIWGLWVTEKRG